MSHGYGQRQPGHRPTQKLPQPGQGNQQYGRPEQNRYGRGDQYGQQEQYRQDPYGQDPYGQDPYGRQDQYGYQEPGYGRPGDGPPPGGPGVGGRRPRKRRVGRILLTIALVIIVLIASVWLYVELSMNRVEALTDYQGRPAAGAGTNWLIVGSDSRADLSAEEQERLATGDAGGQRTDTIMLLHIPDNDTKPTLVSLLRDSYVDIPGKSKNKLNAAFSLGGPQLLAKTVELATGLRLDHYLEIGFSGFADLVDSVGGVDICVKDPIDDPKAGIKLAAGCQELDGQQALGYVRTRATPRADLDRVIHQREFVSALMAKATSFGTIVNPLKSVPLVLQAPDAITVDEGDHLHNLPSVASAMSGAGDGSLLTTTVPMGGSKRVSKIGDVILWDETKAKTLFGALRTDAEVPANVVTAPPT